MGCHCSPWAVAAVDFGDGAVYMFADILLLLPGTAAAMPAFCLWELALQKHSLLTNLEEFHGHPACSAAHNSKKEPLVGIHL